MPDVKWTDAQKNAINARNGSVLVSAAAGSGKTAVLVQRIIESITDTENPVSIDRMLIVTFTRAASSEMRHRIETAINELLRKDPYNKYLLSQKQLLYSARISTIDSFCSEFVRQYFYKLNIQSDFRNADDGELDILRSKALDNTLESLYSEKNPDFIDLVNSTCSYRNDNNLKKNILMTYKFLTAIPFMDNWTEKMISYYNKMPFTETPYCGYILKYAQQCISYCRELIGESFAYLEQDVILKEKDINRIRDMLNSDLTFFDTLSGYIEDKNWDKIKSALESNSFVRFPTIKGSNDDLHKLLIKSARDNYKGQTAKLSELFYQDVALIESNTKKLYPLIKMFFKAVLKFRDEFSALKAEKNILDFPDVERLMVKLLCENVDGQIRYTDISEEISEMFDAIMVDEFQDVNEVQDLIFRAVSRDKNNIFVVGDVKQSIYGFRQARPEIFIGYKNLYSTYSEKSDNYPAKIILDRNFRSCKGITDACNFIFSTLMSEDVGGLEYDDEEKLVCSASYPESESPDFELMLINSSNINEEKNETELILEASKVCEKIYKIIFEEKMQIKDGDTTRTATYGDIAVLLRTAKGETGRAATFVNTLNQYAIPTVSQEKNSFFDALEIKIMLNFLRVIDNPIQDIPLLSVLMSPMFSFTADDIAQARAENRKTPLYIAVKNSKNKKCVDFIEFLDKMRTLSVTTTVDRLIGIILDLTGFDCVAMSSDKFIVNNIYLLQDYARSYANNGYKTLTAFINYIDRIKERGTFLKSVGEVCDSSINAVKVMSIHSSKGLEFPICFISSTSTVFNLRDASEDLVIDADCGAGIRIKKDILKFDTIQRKALSLMSKASMISEEMRVLYVALTRAKQRVIVTATNNNPEKYIQSLESKIPVFPISPFVVNKLSSYSDWLFACALANPSCNIRTNIEPDYSNYIENCKPWNIEIVDDEILYSIQDEKSENNELIQEAEPDEDFLKLFKERINFKYKNQPLSTMPQKVSASELSHKDNRIFNKILKKPSFIYENKADGAERGTAFHNFMECCDLKKARENCKSEAYSLRENGFLTERQIELLDFEKLESFLNGELIERVIKSEKFYREYLFTVKINAEDYNSEINDSFKNQKIVMQGAVDLVFIENGEAVIVDYKTDRVKEITDLEKLYRKQVELYKSALEETTSLPVREAIIYSVHLNKSLKVV